MATDTQTLSDMEAADEALSSGQDEALETATPAPEPSAPPAPAESSQPRDETGRFTSPAPTPEPPASSPAPDAPPADELAAESPVTPPPPFAYEADGQQVVIEGSESGADGVFIPAAQIPKIQRLLAEGHAWNGSARRVLNDANQRHQSAERKAKGAEERFQASEAQLTHILGHFEQLVEASKQYPREQMLESPIGAWLMDMVNGWGVLKADARATRVEREGKAARDRLAEIEAERHEAELRPQMDRTLSDHILHFGQREKLSREVMEDIYATLHSKEYEGVTWIKAPQDDPMNGITKGETVLNLAIIEREVGRAKKWMPAAAPTVPTNGAPPKVQAAPVKKPTPPPTVSATRGPSPRKVIAEPTNKEEADRWLSEGGNDPD